MPEFIITEREYARLLAAEAAGERFAEGVRIEAKRLNRLCFTITANKLMDLCDQFTAQAGKGE